MTDFLDKLDRQGDAAMKKVHPRKNRVVGTPLNVNAPDKAKDWMLREGLDFAI